MSNEHVLAALEKATSLREARLVVSTAESTTLGEEFFRRVAALSGESPEIALKLARHWRAVGEQHGQLHYAVRARAAGERLQGKWLKSAQTFVEAGKLCSNPIEQLSFQAGAVDGLARGGKITEAVRLGTRLTRGLEKMGEQTAAARIKLNLGNALVWADDYGKAQKWITAALPKLETGELKVEAAAAKLALSTIYLFGPKPHLSAPYARQAFEWFEANGFQYYSDLCTINLALDAMLRGKPDISLSMLLELRARMAGSPVDLARIEEYLGDAYLKLNLFEEAIDSYESASRLQAGKDMALSKAHCAFGRGCAYAGLQETRSAAKWFAHARKLYQRVENRMWASAAWAGAISARNPTRGKLALRAQVDACIRELRSVKSTYYLATTLLRRARLSDEPKLYLKEALSLIRRHGFIGLEWEVEAIRASLAKPAERLTHYRRSFSSVLRCRMLASSSTGRIRFLRDKNQLLAGYLDELLSVPSQRRVHEAVRVITACRSVALIDEILSANSNRMTASSLQELNRLREELNATMPAGDLPSNERRGELPRQSVRHLQRRWIEMTTHLLETSDERAKIRNIRSPVIFSDTGSALYRLHEGKSTKLEVSPEQLRETLKWLHFDMLSPMLDSNEPATGIGHQLVSLSKLFQWEQEISPDGDLWGVPWQALAALSGKPEPVLLANPVFTREVNSTLPSQPRVCIWYLDTKELPHVVEEVERISRMFTDIRVCKTVKQVRDTMETGDYDVLHVAGHARFNSTNPMFSFLEFEGGNIYANEIAGSALRCRTVILSACETGSLSFSFKEEPEGLARAFLSRSAHAVLASSWVVNDEAGSRFMESLYRHWKSGVPFVDSVRAARTECREWQSHPYYWAPFVIYGGY